MIDHWQFTLSPRGRRMATALVISSVISSVIALSAAPAALAHGHIQVGDFELAIGFAAEPAYQGEPNGLDLRVTRLATASGVITPTDAAEAGETGASTEDADHEHAPGEADDHGAEAGPVEGLETTLQAELIFGASQKTLAIEPMWNDPGAYTAAVIPTEAGDYTWRIFGTIEGTPVDVSMTSAPDTFASIETKAAVAFPEPEPAAAELGAGIAAVESELAGLASTSQTALMVAGLGVLLGLAALAVAVVAMRRKPA